MPGRVGSTGIGQGGRLPNAGRKKGSRNKRTQEQIELAKAGGKMPLDYLLSIMRNPKKPEALRIACARDAAPYLHPRLQSITHKDEQLDPSKMTDEQLDAAIKLLESVAASRGTQNRVEAPPEPQAP
jgi:hypothetical protein